MEARARAAVSKLQELTQAGTARETGSSTPPSGTPAAEQAPAAAPATELTSADAESISRTLLLAQRTADATIADAKAEAASLTAAAKAEAASIIDAAKADGRRAKEDERLRAEGEVQALIARRDFLVSDVDHLEQHIGAQRERLRDAAVAIQDLVERVPGGLGEIRRPLLSASDTTDVDADMTGSEAVLEEHDDDEPAEVSPTGVGELPRA
jgi:hypothetical protein